MNRVHNYQVIQVITLIIMVLVMFLIVFINSSSESIAVAENVSTMAAEEESAMLTESDDIAGYAGKTIRDYESVRTIPDISHDGIDLVLNTSTDDAIVKIVPKAYFMTARNTPFRAKITCGCWGGSPFSLPISNSSPSATASTTPTLP